MALTVGTNLAAMNAFQNLNRTNGSLQDTFARISSGSRIARAADDAAGLAVAENLDATQQGLSQALRNVFDGISTLQTAEGAATEIGDILKRMRSLAVQSSSDTLADQERSFIQEEFGQLFAEIDRIANTTEFNGVKLADGSVPSLSVQVGISDSADDRISINLGDLTTASLFGGTPEVGDAVNARDALDILDGALDQVNAYRSNLGAVQNRLTSAGNNLEVYVQNIASAESVIRDADFAFETAEMTKYQIMQQAGTAVLAQANAISQGAIQLLG
ncbi:MAG: flagellin [Myxococcota bacterium]